VIRVIYRKKGFTLIEIMIVISIISLLSIILVPKVGAVRVESKNNKVSTNVLLVRTYLDNRSGKDSIKIGDKNDSTTLSNIVNSILGDMNSNFSGSNALENPFNGSEKILSQGEIKENAPSKNASVLIYYSTGALPASSDITKSNSFPKGEDIKGSTVVVVYGNKGGYALYGVDNYGNIISPYIIKFPPSLADMELSDDNQGNDDEQGNDEQDNDNDSDIADIFYKNCLNIFGDGSSSNIQLGNAGKGNINIQGSVYLQGNSITIENKGNGDVSTDGLYLQGTSILIEDRGNGGTYINGPTYLYADTITMQNNGNGTIKLNSSAYLKGISDVTVGGSKEPINFTGLNFQVESDKDISFLSNIKVGNTKFSAVAGGNISFDSNSKESILNDAISTYIEAPGYTNTNTAVKPDPIPKIKWQSIYNNIENPSGEGDSHSYQHIDVYVINGGDTNGLKEILNTDSDKYKFLIINGDFTINAGSTLSNVIIYCTGKITVGGNTTLENSSIIANNISGLEKLTGKRYFQMEGLKSTKYTDEVKDEINKAFNKYVKN
jgi:prepilin-type N-terminal cleavage/methylation domain-containing protein